MNPLNTQDLSGTLSAVGLNERVRQRLREEKAKRKLSERDIAGFLKWSQSKTAYKFNGRTPMTLDEFEGLCFALGLLPSEAIRDRGLEFCAEMTPSELRRHEVLRQLPKATLDAVDHLLRIAPSETERRGATPKRSLYGKVRSR